MTDALLARSNDLSMRSRAKKVIPGGMYGHQSARDLPSNYPQFFRRGTGALITDVDGNEYVDLMCSYGPIILGHQYGAVEEAVDCQRLDGDCFNAPTERLVEFAELLVETIADCDWVIFAKNGTDATTACLTIARAATGRSIILAARGSYHGAAPWCTPNLTGVIATDRAAIRYFEYNDIESLEQAVREAGDELAGVIITPFKHIEGLDQELVDLSFAQRLRTLCDENGALLILDDVRCGFRINVGGSWEPLGIRVDLSSWSKALANGYALAAITGAEKYRSPASEVFVTGSFWFAGVSMAAGLATLNALQAEDGPRRILESALQFKQGVEEQADQYSLKVKYTGHPSMPYLTFASDSNYERMNVFASTALDQGLYIAPKHNWFFSLSMDDEMVSRALSSTEIAFNEVVRRFGTS